MKQKMVLRSVFRRSMMELERSKSNGQGQKQKFNKEPCYVRDDYARLI